MEASAATVLQTTSSFQTRLAARPIQVSDYGDGVVFVGGGWGWVGSGGMGVWRQGWWCQFT